MHMGLGLGHSIEQRHTHQLTADQKLELRLELQEAIHGERYRPEANCPACGRSLTVVEIMKGFNRDPSDPTTKCPKCEHRFQANLLHYFGRASSVRLAFYCPVQTTAKLTPEMAKLSPEEMKKEYASVVQSAMAHFGTLKAAFAKVNIDYLLEAVKDWKEKIVDFLGKMPDSIIAECVGTSRSTIRRLRVKKGIEAFVGND